VALAAADAAALALEGGGEGAGGDERPEPGGPVKIQACVIAPAGTSSPATTRAAAAAARRRVSTGSSWPTRSAKTSVTPRMVLRGSDTSECRAPAGPAAGDGPGWAVAGRGGGTRFVRLSG
jgi:hypothetical protein